MQDVTLLVGTSTREEAVAVTEKDQQIARRYARAFRRSLDMIDVPKLRTAKGTFMDRADYIRLVDENPEFAQNELRAHFKAISKGILAAHQVPAKQV